MTAAAEVLGVSCEEPVTQIRGCSHNKINGAFLHVNGSFSRWMACVDHIPLPASHEVRIAASRSGSAAS